VISIDPSFGDLTYGNTVMEHVFHSPTAIWHEGPTWNAMGKFLVWERRRGQRAAPLGGR
jgi:hypothetical protein